MHPGLRLMNGRQGLGSSGLLFLLHKEDMTSPIEKMDHPVQSAEQSEADADGTPKFGRLLIVLLCAVLLIVAITFATEAYYS